MDAQRKKEAKLSAGVGSSRWGITSHFVNNFSVNKAVSVFTKGIVQTYEWEGSAEDSRLQILCKRGLFTEFDIFLFEMSVEKQTSSVGDFLFYQWCL